MALLSSYTVIQSENKFVRLAMAAMLGGLNRGRADQTEEVPLLHRVVKMLLDTASVWRRCCAPNDILWALEEIPKGARSRSESTNLVRRLALELLELPASHCSHYTPVARMP